MAGSFGRAIVWGMAAGVTTRVARGATRRALHDDLGAPRLPRPARQRDSFATALLLAAGTGALLALADVLKEQRQETTRG